MWRRLDRQSKLTGEIWSRSDERVDIPVGLARKEKASGCAEGVAPLSSSRLPYLPLVQSVLYRPASPVLEKPVLSLIVRHSSEPNHFIINQIDRFTDPLLSLEGVRGNLSLCISDYQSNPAISQAYGMEPTSLRYRRIGYIPYPSSSSSAAQQRCVSYSQCLLVWVMLKLWVTYCLTPRVYE